MKPPMRMWELNPWFDPNDSAEISVKEPLASLHPNEGLLVLNMQFEEHKIRKLFRIILVNLSELKDNPDLQVFLNQVHRGAI